VSGVGIDHVRRHMTIRMVKRGHVIRHVTCLRASEDYTSRHDLESSEIRHVISKTFRDKKQIVTKLTIAREVLSERKPHAFKEVTIACIA